MRQTEQYFSLLSLCPVFLCVLSTWPTYRWHAVGSSMLHMYFYLAYLPANSDSHLITKDTKIHRRTRWTSSKIHSSTSVCLLPFPVVMPDCSWRVDADSRLNHQNWLLESKDVSISVQVIFWPQNIVTLTFWSANLGCRNSYDTQVHST